MRRMLALVVSLMMVFGACAGMAEDEITVETILPEIAGTWYEDEIMMEISSDGRFTIGWNDGDWTGKLEPEVRVDEEYGEYFAFPITLDDPDMTSWEDLVLVLDLLCPGRLVLLREDNPIDSFYNVPVYVKDMAQEDLSYYEPYILVDGEKNDEEEMAVTMMFTLLRPAKDIALMKMFNQAFDEDGNLGYDGDTIEWWAELDSRTQIVYTHVFEGDYPDLSFSFIGEDEIPYNFAVEISGESGDLILTPLLPSNG